jgi:hypothetical protein
MQHVQAFLIHQNNHYYCLRRFRLKEDYFFKIDSKSSQNHERIFRENISKYIDDLIRNKSACIYVILQYVENGDNRQLSMDNIKKRLWALPDAPADG